MIKLNLQIVDKWRRYIIVLSIIVIIGVFTVSVLKHFDYTPDDTYIYLQFAKNVISGNGVSFNRGEPTYGITSPLWLFIISLSGMLDTDLYFSAKYIDIFFACFYLFIFLLLANDLINDVVVALCSVIAFSLNVWLMRWSGTGMETSLALFLLLLTMRYLFQKKYYLLSVFAGLLTLVRPEACVIIFLIVMNILIIEKSKYIKLKQLLLILLVYLIILIPWYVYAYFSFGTIVPNTALAKAGLSFNIDDSFSTFTDIFETILFSDGLSIILFVLGFTIIIYRRKKIDNISGLNQFMNIGVGFIIILPLIFILTGVNVVSRYLLLITPLILVFAYKFLFEIISTSAWKRYTYFSIFIFTVGVMFQNQFVYTQYVKPGIDAFEEGMELSLIPIGKWLKSNTDLESIIFAQDIGAIGYFSDRKLCDAAGLVSPNMLSLLRSGYTNESMMKEKIYNSVCSADYVVYRSLTPEDLRTDSVLVPLFTKVFPQMGLADNRVNYYTVYKVKKNLNKVKHFEK